MQIRVLENPPSCLMPHGHPPQVKFPVDNADAGS
jgi:hypothetical protein